MNRRKRSADGSAKELALSRSAEEEEKLHLKWTQAEVRAVDYRGVVGQVCSTVSWVKSWAIQMDLPTADSLAIAQEKSCRCWRILLRPKSRPYQRLHLRSTAWFALMGQTGDHRHRRVGRVCGSLSALSAAIWSQALVQSVAHPPHLLQTHPQRTLLQSVQYNVRIDENSKDEIADPKKRRPD